MKIKMEIIHLIIHILITMFGFYESRKNILNQIKKEMNNQQKIEAIKILRKAYIELNNGFNAMIMDVSNELYENTYMIFDSIETIFLYGGENSLKIIVHMYKLIEEINNKEVIKNSLSENIKIICCISLLMSQLKYEITGQKVNPKYFYKLLLESEAPKQEFKEYNNYLVDKLNLYKEFIITGFQ